MWNVPSYNSNSRTERNCCETKPSKPVKLLEKFQVKLTLFDKAVCVDDNEESEGDVQVEGDVRYGHEATPGLCVEIIIVKS